MTSSGIPSLTHKPSWDCLLGVRLEQNHGYDWEAYDQIDSGFQN